MKILKPLGVIFRFSLHGGFHTAAMEFTSDSWGRCHVLLASAVVGLFGLLVWFTAFDGWRVGPFREILQSVPMSDKVGHFVIYGSIAFFAALLAKHPTRIRAAGAAVMLLGIADEFRQIGEFGRTYSVEDVIANGLGILAGVAIAKMILRRQASVDHDHDHELTDGPTPVLR